jgi:hypothetical protein
LSAIFARDLASPDKKDNSSREIDAVIASLQNLQEIRTIPYTPEGRARMIDLKPELEARLASSRPEGNRHDS